MNADIKWLDAPEVFRLNQMAAHSDHEYYIAYEDMEAEENGLTQSLNGQWDFCYSINAKSRPETFYREDFDCSGFDKIMVPGHIGLSGYDKIRYINTMYPWEGCEYRRAAYSLDNAGDGEGMFSEAEYNPVGSYIKRFDLDANLRGMRITLFFEGGGFIWDFIDQAIYVKDEISGKDVLRYGGDFDDRPADYEFSGNGIVFADRREKPAMQWELKRVFMK